MKLFKNKKQQEEKEASVILLPLDVYAELFTSEVILNILKEEMEYHNGDWTISNIKLEDIITHFSNKETIIKDIKSQFINIHGIMVPKGVKNV